MASSAVGRTEGTGWGLVPLKWPQYPFSCTAFSKQIEKIAQFKPEASSLGIDDGRVSARAVAVAVDIAGNERGHREFFAEETWGPITCKIRPRQFSVFAGARNTDKFT